MENPPQNTTKFFKACFAFSMVMYFVVSLLIQNFIFLGSKRGFLYEAHDDDALFFSYLFLGLALLPWVLQFLLPAQLRSRAKTPQDVFTAEICRFILCESIAALGFVLFLVTGNEIASWSLIGVGFLTLLFGARESQQTL